jgi:hypothetical protein
MHTLDPAQDLVDLKAALSDYQVGIIPLPELRRVAETIVDRWRDASSQRPPFDQAEIPLWNVAWEIIIGCRESLGAGGAARLRAMLEGDVAVRQGGPELRP